jgi:predicted ATPase
MDHSQRCQVIMATHAPMLMAYPGARLLRLTKYGLDPTTVESTDHYRLLREFCADPQSFIDAMLEE